MNTESSTLTIISKISGKSEAFLLQNLSSKGLWDSFLHIDLVLSLEETFKIRFDRDDVAEMTTPEKVLRLIESKLKSDGR